MSSWINDLRVAARTLRRAPGFAVGVILTIALGVAGVTAVYALLDAVLLRPLPLPEPEQVVALHRVNSESANLSLPDVIALRERLQNFSAIATVSSDFALDRVDGDAPERVRAALVEADYFAVVALPPLHGRLLRRSDDMPGAAPVVVLSEAYWRSHFNADPQAVGRQLTLSDVRAEIVGIVSDRADLLGLGTALWAPLPPFLPWALGSPGSNSFDAVARIRSGVDTASARAELHSVSTTLAAERGNPDKQLDATPWIEFVTAGARQGLWLLFAAVALLLVLATANVAALVLVRTTRRRAEVALRYALGASRRQMLRLLLAEAGVLGLIGGGAGLLLAWLALALIQHHASMALPRLADLHMDVAVIGVAALATLGSVALFSVLPAWSMRTDRAMARQTGIGQPRSETRRLATLVSVEVALACALLGCAALLTRSFIALANLPLGFDAQSVITADVVLPESRYTAREPQTRALTTMVEALASQPDVLHAAVVVGPPLLAAQGISHSLLLEGRELHDADARYRPIVGDYFAAMGVATLAGRGVQAGDERGERIAWVNQAFVRRYLDGIDPIGTRVAWKPGEAGSAEQPLWMRVVGVVADVRGSTLRSDDVPSVYAPYAQREANWIRSATLVARVSGDAAGFGPRLAAAARQADAALPIGEVSSMVERSARALARDRYMLQLVAAFATLALALGLQGVYSVVAFAAEQRRSELGVRMALGASPQQATGVLIRASLSQVLLGTAIGLGLTLTAGRLLAGVLYGVSAFDPLALLLSASVLVCGALLAAWIPARRARNVQLSQCLRG